MGPVFFPSPSFFLERTMRQEHDFIGIKTIPPDAYWGIHTARAVENFPITGQSVAAMPALIRAFAFVKKAAAHANLQLGTISEPTARAIAKACDDLIAGQLHDQFVVDVIQGGAGTSTNMNANEVIANRALEHLGLPKGRYDVIHPNDHVNASQSTNDAYPTAVKLATYAGIQTLLEALAALRGAFEAKAEEFASILKIGRTQLQDAVPMTLGQEFQTYAIMLGEDEERLKEAALLIREMNLGATAIGTGITAPPDYAPAVLRHLREITGFEQLANAKDLIEATSDTGVFLSVSSVLKRSAMRLSKICNDLRLLSSGPQVGLGEINLPAMQAGSSIMPGKVNPVIPEAVNQVAFIIAGADMTVSMASEAGQLQLNAFEPVMAHVLLQNSTWLRRAVRTLRINCVDGITANEERLRSQVDASVGVVTALTPKIGYAAAARLAKQALATGDSIRELVLDDELLTSAELDTMLDPTALSGGLFDTGPLPALTPEAIAKVEAALDEADRHDKA